MPESTVRAYVEGFVERRQDFLSLAEEHGSPLYVFDELALREQARTFRRAFERVAPRVSCYFAVKSNNHPLVAKTLLAEHFGLDVSSGVELQAALAAGADDIVLSGPGKTLPELSLAVENADRVTVLIDSFGELERLAEIARSREHADSRRRADYATVERVAEVRRAPGEATSVLAAGRATGVCGSVRPAIPYQLEPRPRRTDGHDRGDRP